MISFYVQNDSKEDFHVSLQNVLTEYVPKDYLWRSYGSYSRGYDAELKKVIYD